MNKNILICSWDDIWEGNDKFEIFEQLHKKFPKFKATFFVNPGICSDAFLKKINLEWIELVYHAENHTGSHLSWSKNETKEWLLKYTNKKYGFVKGFKAPAYKWSKNIIDACNELNFWMCSSPSVPFFTWVNKKWYSEKPPLKIKKYWYTNAKESLSYYKNYTEFYDHIQNKNFDKNLKELKEYCQKNNPNFKFISEVII